MPTPEWYAADEDDADRATPATGHRAADVSDPDARRPLEDTPTYLRRLSTELKEAREENERLTGSLEVVAQRLTSDVLTHPEDRNRMALLHIDAALSGRSRPLALAEYKLREAEAEVARLTPKPGCRVCGRTDCATT